MLLSVQSLSTEFRGGSRVVRAANDVSFDVDAGEVVALVGESGSGKTVSAYSVLRLIRPPGEIVGGDIDFMGRDVLAMPDTELRDLRGREIAMVFQEPAAAFDPISRVGDQIAECIRHHLDLGKREADARVVELLQGVGIPDAKARARSYPFQFSGGMLQRAMIAMAMSCNPKLLIADEPTTSLDATTQLQVMELLHRLVRESGTALLLITHNLGLVARYADRVYVMKGGQIVEQGSVDEIWRTPAHPYTTALWRAVPRLDGAEHQNGHHKAPKLPESTEEWVDLSPTHRVRRFSEPAEVAAS